MNQEFTNTFSSLLNKSFREPEFTSLDETQYGEFVKGFTDNFISSYKLNDEDNKRYYESLAETTLGNYRKRNNIPRFVPTREQSSELFERFPDLSLVDNIDEREKKVDEWRNKSFEKASALRPAEREDIGVYLDALSNNFIRESASELNQTNWVGDKVYRFAEAFARPVHELIDKPGAERAWAKTAPEDPNRDEDFTSMLASGFGQAGMQIAGAITLTAAGQPELVPYVFGAMYGAQYMKDGYYEEMRRSGDEDKAWNNAVSQLPAAALDTFGDIVLTRGVTKTARGYGKAFASATTEAEKRAVLREALPSMGKEIGNQFISEGLVGGFGADFASGIGSYLATGNEDYLNSFGDMVKSGLAEGLVGAVTGGAVHGFTAGNTQTRIAEDISVLTGFEDIKAKQEGINEALKRRDFDKVISLTNGQFVDPSQFDAHLEASDTLRGRATDENGEPVAKPKEKNDTSSRVPVSSPISSKARGKLLEESVNNDSEIAKLSALPSRTEEEEKKLKSLTERNNYVKGVIESVNNKTYQNPTEIDLTFDDSNDAFYDGKESKEKPQRDGIHEVVLDNGETLNDDGAVVYFDKKFQQDFNTAVAHYGKENVSIKRNVNGNTANIYINKDGKFVKTNAESSYNVNPSKGAVPVSFVENEDSKSVKVKFHPTVKDSTKLPANFTIVEDTGDSVKVRHSDGRVFTFTGDRAIAAREMNAKREEAKKAKEDKKKKQDKTEKPKDSGKQLPSLLDDSEINQENPASEEKFTQKKVNQNDPMSVLVDEELRSLSNSERKKLSPGRFERQSLSDVSDKGVDLWHEGKRGRVKKDATTGRFYFEAEDKTQIELNGNAESSLASVGITKGGKPGSPKEKVSLTTNKPSSEKKQSHKTLISSLKEKLDQIHHDSIDRLSSISGIINKLISLGVEYRVMSQEEIAKEYGENNSPGFATSDGKIVFNLDALNATNKHDLLFKILAIHESAHAGIYIVAQQNPELYQAAKESVNNNPELISLAREEYGKDDNGNYRFDSMNQDGIFHETIRMIIEGRLAGRTTGLSESGPLKAFLQKLIDYIRNIMWRTSDRIVFQFVKNVEDVIGVTNSAIKIENENITVNDIPSNIISDFVRIINGEDVDLENYKRDQLRDLADLMRIKRDRPDIKERLLSRIKEYKPVGDSSNTSIINNSQPLNIGDKFSFRLANELRNANDTFLGLKIANDRTLPVQNIIAKVSKSGVNEFEVETLTNLINSLDNNGRVNIDELSNLVDNEPTILINTLDFGGGSVSRRAELEHKFDTINPSWREIVDRGNEEEMNSLPASILDNLAEWMDIDETGKESATGRFVVDPYSNEVLSGAEIEPGHRLIWSGDLSLNIPIGSNPIIRQKQIDNFEQVNAFAHEVKFTSQHYNGDVAENQLAFVRGGIHEYQKGNKLPDGTIAQDVTRIFEIWEVQSDWAGKVANVGGVTQEELDKLEKIKNKNDEYYGKVSMLYQESLERKKDDRDGFPTLNDVNDAYNNWFNSNAAFKEAQRKQQTSPLLKYWESLALKAAVNHAQKQGATNIIVSDAETAMMTEGHDNVNYLDNNVDDNQIIEKYPLGYLIPIGKDGNVTATIAWSSKDIIREDTGETVASLGMGNRLIISGVQTLRNPGLEPRLKEIFGDNLKLDKLEAVYSRPSEEKGMRAAYDERVPNGLSKLSGSKGKKVTVGEHNKGPSKVFNNPDGTPKNTNTGLMFPVNNNVELQFSQPITNENISDQNSQITNENITEEEVIDLTSLSGESVSIVRKNQIKRINELRKRKIEAKLGPEEKSALSILKGIKALAALPDESLEKYANLMEDFIDTRSRSSDAAIERIPIEEFLSKVHELDSEAKHAWFKQQQEDFPELQGKDFDKDYNGEMDQVKADIDFIQENDKTIGIDRVNKNREMYLDKIDALRDLIIDNIDDMKDNMLRRIDDVSFNKTDSKHLKAGTWLMQDTMDDLKQYFEDYLNSILTIDVSQSSSKDIRKTYYSLMGVAYDGYMLSANNFISSDIMSMLQNDATPLDVFASKNKAELVTKVMSISAQMRSTMDTKGYEILNRIAGKFRESIKKSHMFQQNALIPYQKESIDKAQERSGFHYSDTHLQKIGIYALSRRIRVSEDPKAEIERNLKQLKDSVINLSRSADKTLNAASEWYNKFIDGLFSGVLESETPLQKLEENASIIGIDDGMKGYVNDIVSFFDHFKPIARFTTEFIYGREFKDEHNYVPSMILNLNPVSGPMQYDVDDLRFDMTSSDIAERNVNVSGLSGTYDRKAQLKQNQAMVFNINHLFSNRGRLNFLDSLSAVPRREIAALFRQDSEGSKAVKSFMHDEHGSKFRYHTLENAFRTMWKNEIESTQYLHEYQGFVNGILSRWAGVVLSSAYQGVGQLISNIAPFITVNIANPGKIMDMFSAFSYAAKYRAGMLTEAQSHLYERLMFDLKNRHQDQVLDTSVNLGITKDSTWQAFKASAAAQGLSKVDKFVEKAKFFQFQEADFWSGAPMMMAEYLHQERKRLGHDIKMEDLIYNEGSYFNAIDETERFIGIGNASRRGEWLTNRNSLATIVRHILTGFAGHRLNNASNAYIEFRKILSNDVSQEEKTKSAAYVASIAVQSAVFTAAKVFVISGIMSLVASILKDKDDDDEELKKLLDEASRVNPADKKVIEAEISKRKEIRSTWENVQRRQDNSYLMTMNLTKDIASNIFIWPNLLEFVPDVLIYSTADAFEEKAFKDFKEKKMKELKTKMTNAKNLGDKVLANRFQLAIASLSSQQAVKVTMPNQGSLVPFNGMYGGAFRNIESVVKAMRDSYLGVDEFNINDFANLATVFGWSTADIQRFTRVAEDLDRANKNYQEKVNPTGKNK